MDRARTNTPPPSSAVSCPACDKPVDSLRAGHVAILEGSFRYFCDASCKSAYVDVTSRRSQLDAMTAEAPPVTSAHRGFGLSVSSGVRENEATPHFPVRNLPEQDQDLLSTKSGIRDHDDEPPFDGFDPEEEPVRVLPHVHREDEPQAASVIPSTLRSPLVTEPRERSDDGTSSTEDGEAGAGVSPSDDDGLPPRTEGTRPGGVGDGRLVALLIAVAPVAGVVAGTLAAAVSLAGEPAVVLRLPLALLAATVVLVKRMAASRERSDVSSLVVGAPIAAASVIAIMSALLHHPHADAHASFVGLAGAAALAVDILLTRAGRDVMDARARTTSALSVIARVVRGGANVSSRAAADRSGLAPEGSRIVELDASLVKSGEQIVVEATQTIPVDGIVAAGEAQIVPWLESTVVVDKKEGDAVVAGAVVVSGRLRVNATFSGAERAWLRLTQKAPSQIEVAAPLIAFVRRAVERGAPASALLVAGAVYADNGSWLDVALAAAGGGYALAAAAAVSAAALAHARGHVTAQRHGIVYKDAAAFDAAARADVAVVCSRGTILLGAPEIVVVEAISKEGRTDAKSDVARVLAIAAGAELSSTHPFASAILREARARAVRPENVRSALGHSGLGVTALAANGDRVIVGSRAFLLHEKVSVAIADTRTSELEAQGRSVLLVAVGGRLVGLLALQDGLRPGARAAIQRMHDARIEPVLLTGEARDTSETIARSLDIEHVRPEILPAERGVEVRSLADGGRVVAALGHASTDDGALGAADVSVAMEAAGSAPGEWSVALASDDVRDAALSLTIPRASRERARTALVVGALTQAASALGIALGIAPAAIVPVFGVLAAAAAITMVRDPEPADDHILPPGANLGA